MPFLSLLKLGWTSKLFSMYYSRPLKSTGSKHHSTREEACVTIWRSLQFYAHQDSSEVLIEKIFQHPPVKLTYPVTGPQAGERRGHVHLLKFSMRGTSSPKILRKKIGQKNHENERKIKKSNTIFHRQNKWTKTDDF